MMSLEALQALNWEIAHKAEQEQREPYVFDGWDYLAFANGQTFPLGAIPNIGYFRPDGWDLVETLFCDKTGLGIPSEPALTVDEILETLLQHRECNFGYAIVEEGEFQLYLGCFIRREK